LAVFAFSVSAISLFASYSTLSGILRHCRTEYNTVAGAAKWNPAIALSATLFSANIFLSANTIVTEGLAMYAGGSDMLQGACSVLGPLDIFFNDSSALSVAFLGQCLLDQLTPRKERLWRKAKAVVLIAIVMLVAVFRASFMTLWSTYMGFEVRTLVLSLPLPEGRGPHSVTHSPLCLSGNV